MVMMVVEELARESAEKLIIWKHHCHRTELSAAVATGELQGISAEDPLGRLFPG